MFSTQYYSAFNFLTSPYDTTEQDTIHSVSHNTLVWFHIILFTYTTYFGRRKLIFSKYILLLTPNDSSHGRNMLYVIQSFCSLSYERSMASSLQSAI